MRTAELINVVYFSGFTVLALVRSLPPRSRRKAVSIGLGALLLTIMSMNFDRWLPAYPSSIIRDWMPAPIIAFAYWISGCFYQQPDPRLQAMFEDFEELILRHLRGGLLPRLGATV